MNYAPRISLSYDEIKLVLPIWAEVTEKICVYQHNADDKVKRTHCHILLIGSSLKEEALKRRFKAVYPDVDSSGGNKFWSWVPSEPPSIELIRYMSKGNLEPKYVKNIENDVIEIHRQLWENYKTPSKQKDKKYDEYDEMKKDFQDEHTMPNDVPILLDNVRTWTMRWYYKRDGRLPPTTCYKRNASSLFVYANEKRAGYIPPWCFEELKNLWY